jgi:hypothetical protein
VAVRLRQVALVARRLEPVAERLQAALGLGEPYHDPGVAEFGLENAVFALGDTFLEVVAPAQPGTAAGRYLDHRGGDSGYMAIFQVPDIDAARARVAALGVRVVWTADGSDIAGTHLHPADVGGAIVSLDWAAPPETWRWAGPAWTGQVPDGVRPGGIRALVVDAGDPVAMSTRWAGVLGLDAGPELSLDGGRQRVIFRRAIDGGEGIAEVVVDQPGDDVEVGGVRFVRLRSGHG